MVTAPFQLVHLNFTSFEMTTNLNELPKVKNVLVVIDHFTRYTRACVIKDQKASTAAKTLYKGFILIFGAPKRILDSMRSCTVYFLCIVTLKLSSIRFICSLIELCSTHYY